MILFRFDLRLLSVAQKLTPLIQESFLEIKDEIQRMVRRERQKLHGGSGVKARGSAGQRLRLLPAKCPLPV